MLYSAVRKCLLVSDGRHSVVKHLLLGENNRYFSTNSKINRFCTDDDLVAYEAALPKFISEVMDYTKGFDSTLGAAWFEKCMRHHVLEEIPARGYLTFVAYKALAKESDLTEENFEIVRKVSWCNKLLEASFQITDDIVDGSKKRRGLTCWHLLPEVNTQIVNDIGLLAFSVQPVLEKIVGNKEYYPLLGKTFMDGGFSLFLGQTLDNLYSREDVTCHTREKYDRIVELKTCNYGTYAPFAMAMNMCGYKDQAAYDNARNIFFAIGRAWQLRNDFLDCFSSSTNITHSDAQENKVTWLSVNFMERANLGQRRAMQNSYGKRERHNVEEVKSLYEEVGIDKLYSECENESFSTISRMTDDSPYENMKPVFRYFRDKLFHEYKKQ